MNEVIICDGFHHEQGEVDAAGEVAFQDGVTDVFASHGKTLAFAFF
jgi:hypothetical protein